MNDPKEKALALSYILCELLIQNLDVAVHELKIINHKDGGKLYDKLHKLNSASRNAFRILEKNMGDDLSQLKNDIEITLDELWGD
jgi:uncharacterized protein YigE (DUF2233 family)